MHRAVDGGDAYWDNNLTDYLVAPDAARLRVLLAPDSAPLTNAELLEFLADRFEHGLDIVDGLTAAGFNLVRRMNDWLRLREVAELSRKPPFKSKIADVRACRSRIT